MANFEMEYAPRSLKRVAIIQSCYIPWKGFFDLISRCDEYILYDQAQYRKRHWHNRNKVKTPRGAEWLTIPVITKSQFEQPIDEVEIAEPWAEKHWRSIELNYARAPYFKTQAERVRALYEKAGSLPRLTEVNELFLRELCEELGVAARIRRDAEYSGEGRKSERLLSLCIASGATHYLSGPSAREYLDEQIFRDAGISVEWMEYGPYREYEQLHGDFEHAVSALDLMFNLGPEAKSFVTT